MLIYRYSYILNIKTYTFNNFQSYNKIVIILKNYIPTILFLFYISYINFCFVRKVNRQKKKKIHFWSKRVLHG